MWCLFLSINLALFCANFPQSKNTRSFLSSDIVEIIWSVNCSHPLFWCDPAVFSLTVKVAFNSSTPCFAHFVKSPFPWLFIFKSLSISLKILTKDGGVFIPSVTENESP